MKTFHRFYILFMVASALLAGCQGIEKPASAAAQPTPTAAASLTPDTSPTQTTPATACSVTEPQWLKPPDDPAVMNPPEFGYYLVNADQSIMASAWWFEDEAYHLRAGKEGNKIGWFRPAGADLKITSRHLDGTASPLEAHIPCCYLTRFQASGLYFPTAGCWEVTARSENSLLKFVVKVEP